MTVYILDVQYNSNMQKLTDDNFSDGHHNFCLQVYHSISKSSHVYPPSFQKWNFKIVSFQFWQKNHKDEYAWPLTWCQTYFLKLFTDHCKSLVDTFCGSCDCDNSLGTGAIWYVYLSTTLQQQRHKYVTPPVPTKTCRKCANAWTPKKKETYIFPKLLYIISFLQKKRSPKFIFDICLNIWVFKAKLLCEKWSLEQLYTNLSNDASNFLQWNIKEMVNQASHFQILIVSIKEIDSNISWCFL